LAEHGEEEPAAPECCFRRIEERKKGGIFPSKSADFCRTSLRLLARIFYLQESRGDDTARIRPIEYPSGSLCLLGMIDFWADGLICWAWAGEHRGANYCRADAAGAQ